MTKKTVILQNSWMMNQVRFHCHQYEFKDYYFDRVLSRIIQEISPSKDIDIEVFFSDNFFCNALILDIEKLKSTLLKLYKSVSVLSENPYDEIIDPKNYLYRVNESTISYFNNFIKLSLATQSNRSRDIPKKYFGLQILRPDTHRLALILELHRRDLLSYFDIRFNMNLDMLGGDEFRRSTNIDMVCWYYDIGFKDFIKILEKLPRGSLDSFTYKKNDPTIMLKNDVMTAALFNDFLIEIVCDSKINDFTPVSSEKHLRPLVNKNPFMILGPRNSYIMIKNLYGAKTFDHLWDESWDDINAEFFTDKIRNLVNTCDNIVKNFTIKDLQAACQDVVEYNFSLISNFDFYKLNRLNTEMREAAYARHPDFFAGMSQNENNICQENTEVYR
jgi:hypothetical protein